MALISIGGSISTLLNIIPVSSSAGRSFIEIFLPECRPNPTAFIELVNVLCTSIYSSLCRKTSNRITDVALETLRLSNLESIGILIF